MDKEPKSPFCRFCIYRNMIIDNYRRQLHAYHNIYGIDGIRLSADFLEKNKGIDIAPYSNTFGNKEE